MEQQVSTFQHKNLYLAHATLMPDEQLTRYPWHIIIDASEIKKCCPLENKK
jgi:hypothetical protein